MLKSNSERKSPGRILVVDDDPDLLRLLSLRLAGENYEVETALNGHIGLDVIADKRPDLLISDLQMEEMNGMTEKLAKRDKLIAEMDQSGGPKPEI